MECEGNGEMAVFDLRHCNLTSMPTDIFKAEPNLEELYLDANQIRELPRVFEKFIYSSNTFCWVALVIVIFGGVVIKTY